MNQDRPYQERDAAAILGSLQRGRKPLYCLPTRGGKTTVTAKVYGRLLGATDWHIGFFVHRRELLKQASDTLSRHGIEHGLIWPDGRPSAHRVHVASIDTIAARLSAGDPATSAWLRKLRLRTFDEAHHSTSDKWQRAIDAAPEALDMGITATPYRLDGASLGDVFNEPIRGPNVADLIRDGWLAPFEVYAPDIAVNLVGLKKRGGDYVASEIQRLMDTGEMNQAAVRAYGRWAPGEPCVVFCTGIEHAEHMATAFRRAGWRACSVDGSMPDRERDAAFTGLNDGSFQVLTSCMLVNEGVDLPALACAIGARPTASTQLYIQSYCRVLTAHEDKDRAIIIDLVGNVAAHGMPDAERDWSLTGGVKRRELQVQATRNCPKCFRVHAKSNECPGCGRSYVRRNPATGRPAERLIDGFTLAEVKAFSYRQAQDLAARVGAFDGVAIEHARGYEPGWAQHCRLELSGRRRA